MLGSIFLSKVGKWYLIHFLALEVCDIESITNVLKTEAILKNNLKNGK